MMWKKRTLRSLILLIMSGFASSVCAQSNVQYVYDALGGWPPLTASVRSVEGIWVAHACGVCKRGAAFR